MISLAYCASSAEVSGLAKQNVPLATETRGILQGINEQISEITEEVRELKQELPEDKGRPGD